MALRGTPLGNNRPVPYIFFKKNSRRADKIQYITLHYSTVHYSTVQYSTVQ